MIIFMGKSPTWITCFSWFLYMFFLWKLSIWTWKAGWFGPVEFPMTWNLPRGSLGTISMMAYRAPKSLFVFREIIPSHGHKIQVSEIIIYPDSYGKSPIHLDDLPTVFIVIFHCQITRRCHSPYWNGNLLVNPMISYCIIISSFDNLSPSHSMPFFVC